MRVVFVSPPAEKGKNRGAPSFFTDLRVCDGDIRITILFNFVRECCFFQAYTTTKRTETRTTFFATDFLSIDNKYV